MTDAEATTDPSSVNRRTPRRAISAIGARRSPARPSVIAPATATSMGVAAPRSSTWATSAALSSAGSVLGIATIAL